MCCVLCASGLVDVHLGFLTCCIPDGARRHVDGDDGGGDNADGDDDDDDDVDDDEGHYNLHRSP